MLHAQSSAFPAFQIDLELRAGGRALICWWLLPEHHFLHLGRDVIPLISETAQPGPGTWGVGHLPC